MGFTEAVNSVLKQNYANFSGRASRSEYWYFTLFVILVAIPLVLLMMLGVNFQTSEIEAFGYIVMAVLGVFYLAMLIPTIAVGVRRLHDRDMSGWWYLGFIALSFIPFVGSLAGIAQLVIFCLKGTDGDNRFGPDPLRPGAGADIFA